MHLSLSKKKWINLNRLSYNSLSMLPLRQFSLKSLMTTAPREIGEQLVSLEELVGYNWLNNFQRNVYGSLIIPNK